MAYEDFRKIIHIDMDAFFASVEQRDNPAYRGKPLAVGGSAQRGVVAAASYEARKFGVKSAMPSKTAIRLCPTLLFAKPRFDVYKRVSNQIREIFLSYTELVEPLSLDEAYLDVTQNLKGIGSATDIALDIKKRIQETTGLTASAGVSYNKFLAKTASDINKPNGIFVIKPNQAQAFIDQLEIKKFHGIGKVTAAKIHQMGIYKGKDLREKDLAFLTQHFGKAGNYYHQIANGQDHRIVNPERIRKSIGVENTFSEDLTFQDEFYRELDLILSELWRRIERSKTFGKTVTLKIKNCDFEQITRSKTAQGIITSEEIIGNVAYELLNNLLPFEKGIRLMGVSISNLDHSDDLAGRQLTFSF